MHIPQNQEMAVQNEFGLFPRGQDRAALYSEVFPSQFNTRWSAQGRVGQKSADRRTLIADDRIAQRGGARIILRPSERADLVTRQKTPAFGAQLTLSLYPPLV